jgi:hypothetical protein
LLRGFAALSWGRRDGMRLRPGGSVQPRRSSTSGLLWTTSTIQIDPRFLFCCVVLLLCLEEDATACDSDWTTQFSNAVQPRLVCCGPQAQYKLIPVFYFAAWFCCFVLEEDATACDSDWTTQFSNAVQPRLVCCGLQAQYKLIPVFYFAAWFCCFVLEKTRRHAIPTGRRSSATPFNHVWSAVDYKHNTN